MDVGSMLNASPEGEEHLQPLHTWEAAIRSRTPWDAGGYSLPVNHNLDPTVDRNIQCNNSLIDSTSTHVYSSKHAISSSRGSLSSFASASTSTHSRFSSASTVSGFRAFSSSSNNLNVSNLQGDSSTFITPSTALSPPTALSPASPATFSIHHYPLSPHGDLAKVLALIAEQQHSNADLFSQDKDRDIAMAKIEHTMERDTMLKPVQPPRAASPTDALLIQRRTLSSLAMPNRATEIMFTGPFGHRTAYVPDDEMHSLAPNTLSSLEGHDDFGSYSGRFASESRRHKRAYSAPHMQATGESSFQHSFQQEKTELAPAYQRYEPTPPPSSRHPSNASPQDETLDALPDLAPENTPPFQEQQTCMFKESCDTGSQLRKAVSHIFGRNKSCTLLIPEHVWVGYCRKHYQRSRYRDRKNWPRSQCDLVQQQIQRLEEWSAENQRRGHGRVLGGWGLAVRKREQDRLDKLASATRDLGHHGGAGFEEAALGTAASAAAVPETAVPAWLRDLCGRTYNTSEIRAIFNRLHREILDSADPSFPDIEILPHITPDAEEPASPRRYSRRTSQTTHQRARSAGVASSQSIDSHLRTTPLSSAILESPSVHKRRRVGSSAEEAQSGLSHNQRRLAAAARLTAHEPPHPSTSRAFSNAHEISCPHGRTDTYHPAPTAAVAAPSHRRSRSSLSTLANHSPSTAQQSHVYAHLTPPTARQPPLSLHRRGEAQTAPGSGASSRHGRRRSSPAGGIEECG